MVRPAARRLFSSALVAFALLAAAGVPQIARAVDPKPAAGEQGDEIPDPFATPKKKQGKKPAAPPPKEEEPEPAEEPEPVAKPEPQEKPETFVPTGRNNIGKPSEDLPNDPPIKAETTPEGGKTSPNADPAIAEAAREMEVPSDERNLRLRIESRAKLVRAGDLSGADVELTSLIDLKEVLGIRNLPLASAELIHEARLALDRGEIDRANLEADAAGRLSPDMVEAHQMRLRAALAYRVAGVLPAFGAIRDLAEAPFHGFRNQIDLLARLFGVIGLALLMSVFVFTLIEVLRYLRLAGHDVVRRLPEVVSDLQGMIVLGLIITAPFVLGYGILASVTLALGLAIAYQTRRERGISILALLVLALIPTALWLAAPLVTFFGSRSEELASLATESSFSTDVESKVAETARGQHDFGAVYLLGLRARMRGDYEHAEEWYREALKIQPGDVATQNNLANVQYLTRRSDLAMATLRQAGASRTYAEPWLNLASVLLDRSLFDLAKQAIEEARQINPEQARRYNELPAGTATSKKLIDVPFDESTLWSRFINEPIEESARAELVGQLWRPLGGKTPPIAMPLLALVVGLISCVLSWQRRALGLSVSCSRCGLPAAPHVREGYCTQCQTIFSRGGAVEPKLRLEKEYHIKLHQQLVLWTERMLGVIAGAGDIFSGRPVMGSVLLFLFSAALIHAGWLSEVTLHPWSTSIGGAPLAAGLSIAVAVLLAVFSLRRTFRR